MNNRNLKIGDLVELNAKGVEYVNIRILTNSYYLPVKLARYRGIVVDFRQDNKNVRIAFFSVPTIKLWVELRNIKKFE